MGKIIKPGEPCSVHEICEFSNCGYGYYNEREDTLCWPAQKDGEGCDLDVECESRSCNMETKTCESKDLICAVEGEKSKECNAKTGKEACCEGLVCHSDQYWRCVKEEDKYCAGPNTLAKDCGSTRKKAAQTCC